MRARQREKSTSIEVSNAADIDSGRRAAATLRAFSRQYELDAFAEFVADRTNQKKERNVAGRDE